MTISILNIKILTMKKIINLNNKLDLSNENKPQFVDPEILTLGKRAEVVEAYNSYLVEKNQELENIFNSDLPVPRIIQEVKKLQEKINKKRAEFRSNYEKVGFSC